MPVSTADLVSPAMACLRVSLLSQPGGQDERELQALVAKVINAFLQSRWEWPRQFEQMTPYAFVLTDPRSDRMDKRGLKALASELQLKLFGSDGEGEVALLLFEGPDMEVHRFARLSVDEVERMLAGEALHPPFEGVLNHITADLAIDDEPIRTAVPAAETDDPEPPMRAAPLRAPGHHESVYAGLYLTSTQSFVGSLALCRRPRRDRLVYPDLSTAEALPGQPAEAFDEGCVESALEALAQGAAGLLFVPLSFSSLVRSSGRRAYARFLCHLPAEARSRLGAAIYDTPRAPSYFALANMRRFLDPFFGELNLQVRDPAFEVERLAPEMVSSVTLALPPEREPAERLAAIRRFMQKRDLYKKKRIWPGVAPLANRTELDACLGLRVPVLGGPAVSGLGGEPLGPVFADAEALPAKG
ncbi:MAG TPA: hypothetical protein VGM25_02225 [Caulobacteraceae bacterium]